MVKLTEATIRKRAEHHDGILADLEELSLHQLEIDRIEALGTYCRKLKILYLQNNIIPRIEGLQHLKDLQYLNMTLNNIQVIEGLSSCEFLSKLDFTVNFIDVDALEQSMEHLRPLVHLKELFLMGNPCQEWGPHREYIIHMLPQLRQYDGKEITRSERILAAQRYPALREELRKLANEKRASKGLPAVRYPTGGDGDDEDVSPWTPEERTRMYTEMAEQKEEQERSRSHMEPKKRDFAKEQAEAVERSRERELAGEIRQCNEGRWEFGMDEDRDNIIVRVCLPRFLDTSLVSVDTHPTYITMVIKGKVLRLRFPEEVLSDSGTAQRSAATGELVITLPKAKSDRFGHAAAGTASTKPATGASKSSGDAATAAAGRVKRLDAPQKLGDAMLEEASKAVSTRGIVASAPAPFLIAERAPKKPQPELVDDNDEVPPLC